MLFLLLRYLNFCPESFGQVEKWLEKKHVASSTVKQIMTVHALPNISRNKCN